MYGNETALIKSLSITFSIFIICLIGSYLFWKLLDKKLSLWAEKSNSNLDNQVVASLRTPSKLLLLGLSLGLSLQVAPLMSSIQNPLLNFSKLVLIISLIWASEKFINAIIISKTLSSSLNESSQSLFKTISRVLVYSIGILIILDSFGISITPLLASLGVGSVAIALAAQETLSNLFSGFYILLDKPFRVGDCIKVDTGAEGCVTKIGWRSTHIRLYSNNIVIIPNAKIASSILTNFDFPNSETSVIIPLGVAYDSDLAFVEQVILEVAFLVQNTLPIASKVTPPSMAYTTFGDSSINLNVVLKANRITDSVLLKHEFIKILHARFKRDNISIPFPQQVIHYTESSQNPIVNHGE